MPENALRSVVGRLRVGLAKAGPEPTDRQLLDAFLHQHDQDAFAQLVRRHQHVVQAAIAKVLVDPADIEDAFQATFLVLVRKARSLSWRSGLGTWLYAVAHRVAVNAWTAVRERVRREGQAARTEGQHAAPDLSWREACVLLHDELNKLPDKFRLPLLLCYLEGKSRDEAAEQLGISPGGVKGRLERGRNLLRDRLARRGVCLSVGLWAVLAHSPAGASPPRLVESAVAVARGAVPARVAALAQGVTARMVLTNIKLFTGALLAAGLVSILLTSQPTPPLAASPPAAAPQKSEEPRAETTKPDDAPKEVEITGRVLDPDGQPAAKVTVMLRGYHFDVPTDTSTTKEVATVVTGEDGRFRMKVKSPPSGTMLVASTAGFGLAWDWYSPDPPNEVTLQLTKDQPITGEVLDLEGKPVQGARIRVMDISCGAKGDLEDYLEDLARRQYRFLNCQGFPEAIGTAVADARGRFRLTGFGRERAVRAVIEGEGIAIAEVEIFTRLGAVPKVNDGRHLPAYRAEFKHIAAPSRPVVGVIRDRDTGKPIAGAVVLVRSEKLEKSEYPGRRLYSTKTDAAGRYRLSSMPHGGENWVSVTSTGAAPYLGATVPVPRTQGTDPITLDIGLKRGVWVECHVTDGAKGKPVCWGTGQYFAEPSNPDLGEVEGNIGAVLHSPEVRSDEQGVIRVAALPGKGLIAVRFDSMYLTADQLGEPEELDRTYGAVARQFNALGRFDAAKDAGAVKLNIRLEKGETIPGKLVGPDGKPVTGAWIFGQRSGSLWSGPVDTDEFTLEVFSRAHPRFVAVTHPEKGLAAVVQVAAGQERITAQLLPAATVWGRLVDADGKPRAGVLLKLSYQMTPTTWTDQPAPKVKTDAEGRFRIPGLLPGVEYSIEGANAIIGGGKWKTGETKDLGDVRDAPEP